MLKSTFLFTLVAMFLFFEMALQVSPGIMTNHIMHSLNIDIFWLGIISGVYFITYTVMQIPAGLFYDIFSPRKVILWPLLICVIGGFLFGIASNVYLAIASRILMGLGSAFAYTGVLVVATHVFKDKYFTLISGITQMLASLGAICGALPLLPLINLFGWRNTMFIISSLGLILLNIMIVFFKFPKKHLIRSYFPIFIALKTVAKQSQTWIIAIYACLLWMPMVVVGSLYGIPFIENNFHLTFKISAMIIIFMWLGVAISSPVFGFIVDKTNKIKLILFICSLIGVIGFFFILYLPIIVYNNIFSLILLFFISGAACSGQALSFSLISRNNILEHRGTAIGFNNMAVVISGFIFQPLVGFVIRFSSNKEDIYNHIYNASSYYNGMLIVWIAYILSMLTVIFGIKNKSLKRE